MEQSIRNEDLYNLQHIVEEANRKFLKQSRINKSFFSSNLNILRVLSSFKELFPSTPQKIYKLLMAITKNHNPQTKQQWNKAIDKLTFIQTKQQTSSHNLFPQDSLFHTRSQSQIHKLKNSNYLNSTKTYKQQLDQQIDTIVSKRSKVNFVADFRETQPFIDNFAENKENNMLMSNKNSLRNSHHVHYISFQPYQRDSMKQSSQLPLYLPSVNCQNVRQNRKMSKKINPYHQITRIDNLSRIQCNEPSSKVQQEEPSSKDDSKTIYSQNYKTQQNSYRCIPTKTQRNFSQTRFINLDSKDSEVSTKNSHLIRNQKLQDNSQIEFYNMTIDQWESLNEKANTFHSFNLKLKAFSALLANYQAFQYDRFLKDKAKIFNTSYLQSKVLIGLKMNLSIQQSIKQKFKKAEKFSNQNLYKKVWKVLQIMKNLKIKKQKNDFQLQKLNKTNFEFFMAFMFAQKSNVQSSPNKVVDQNLEQKFEFENKVEYFSRTQNFQNVWDIYKCFGLNINISKEKLTEFFTSYHQCIMKQSFSAFKNHYENQKQKYLKLHQKRLVQKVFSILLSKKEISQSLKKQQQKAENHASKNLKLKTYKILLSIVYSTKIFSKRQQFIQVQKMNRTKKNILAKLISSYQEIKNYKLFQQAQFTKMCKIFEQYIMKKSFQKIRNQSLMIENKCHQISKYVQNSIKQSFVAKLSQFLEKKKKYLQICQRSSKHLQSFFLYNNKRRSRK